VVVDLFLVYQFIRKLVKPFKDWDAYELGIIDDQGKVLRKRKDLTRGDERKAFGLFDLMILNIKKLLAKVPGGQTKLATYAAALFLIREFKELDENVLTEDVLDDKIEECMESFLEYYQTILLDESFEEESMAVGSGAIAGLGVGPDGEPGITKKVAKKYKDKNKKDTQMLTFKEASLKMKGFKKDIDDQEAPKGFYKNKDGTISIDHDTSNKRPRKKKKINESLLKKFFGKGKPDHEKTLSDHAAEHNKDSVNENHKYLTKHSEDAHKDSHESKSIHHFKENSVNMNQNLIRDHKMGRKADHRYDRNAAKSHKRNGDEHEEEDRRTEAHVHHTILKHSKPLGKNIALYHGTGHDFEHAAKKSKNGIIHSPAHLSTSHDHSVAADFAGEGGDIVVIHAKKKHKGVYVDGKHPGTGGGEKETVIPAGTKLKHIKSHLTKDGYRLHHFNIHEQPDHKPYDKD